MRTRSVRIGVGHLRSNHHCGASARKQCAAMFDMERVLPTALAADETFGVHIKRAGEIVDPRNDLDSVTMAGQRWMYHTADSKVLHTTFNTPLNPPVDDMGAPQYCGRVVFSDFHVSANEVNGKTFPSACQSGPLTTQEKALVFMLFDLSSCVQSDSVPPVPPIT